MSGCNIVSEHAFRRASPSVIQRSYIGVLGMHKYDSGDETGPDIFSRALH